MQVDFRGPENIPGGHETSRVGPLLQKNIFHCRPARVQANCWLKTEQKETSLQKALIFTIPIRSVSFTAENLVLSANLSCMKKHPGVIPPNPLPNSPHCLETLASQTQQKIQDNTVFKLLRAQTAFRYFGGTHQVSERCWFNVGSYVYNTLRVELSSGK